MQSRTFTRCDARSIGLRMHTITFAFDSLRDRAFTEQPADLMSAPKDPQNMAYRELGEFIAALERSGGDANELRVERALKIAIPMTCLVIALFGAPLATSTQRGGAAYGVGVSLALLTPPASWIVAAGTVAATTALFAWAIFRVNSGFWIETHWRAPRSSSAPIRTRSHGLPNGLRARAIGRSHGTT